MDVPVKIPHAPDIAYIFSAIMRPLYTPLPGA